jgi:hypothetical protein
MRSPGSNLAGDMAKRARKRKLKEEGIVLTERGLGTKGGRETIREI